MCQRAGGCDRAGGNGAGVAVAQHDGQRDQAHRDDGRGHYAGALGVALNTRLDATRGCERYPAYRHVPRPVVLVVGPKGVKAGVVEVRDRKAGVTEEMSLDAAVKRCLAPKAG